MRRSNLTLTAIVAIVLSAACGSSPTSNPSPNTSSAVASPTASAKAGTLDPCLLVTMQEASALAGITLGAGVEKTIATNSQQCIYSNQSSYIFTVGVIQASSPSEAQAGMQAAVASIQSQTDFSVTVTQLPSFADGGVEVQGGASGASVAGIYALHSSVAFGFVAFGVNHPVPTNAAMVPTATTMLGRLP